MTPEQQRIAIAEWCGWKYKSSDTTGDFDRWLDPQTEFNWVLYSSLPDYLNDLNAMHEVESKLDGGTKYIELLTWVCDHDWQHAKVKMHRNPIFSTSAQRAEALLRTIGKWKE